MSRPKPPGIIGLSWDARTRQSREGRALRLAALYHNVTAAIARASTSGRRLAAKPMPGYFQDCQQQSKDRHSDWRERNNRRPLPDFPQTPQRSGVPFHWSGVRIRNTVVPHLAPSIHILKLEAGI